MAASAGRARKDRESGAAPRLRTYLDAVAEQPDRPPYHEQLDAETVCARRIHPLKGVEGPRKASKIRGRCSGDMPIPVS